LQLERRGGFSPGDFPDLAQQMAAARSIIVVMREQYNVLQ
jgi:hypothetical protein